MRKISVVILLVWSLHAIGQVPGYMGKRFSIFLEANPTPALLVQNVNNKVVFNPGGETACAGTNKFALNIRPQATIEYLVSRDVSLGFSYSRIGMGVSRAYGPHTGNGSDYLYDMDVVRGQSAGFHIKLYHFKQSGSVAPIGYYTAYSGYMTQINSYDTKKSTRKIFLNDFQYPVAAMSFGRQSPLGKNLLLKTGFELGWAFVPYNFISDTPDAWTVQEYAGYHVQRSLFFNYLFSINIALGYIPF
jgi:hypothetical protein